MRLAVPKFFSENVICQNRQVLTDHLSSGTVTDEKRILWIQIVLGHFSKEEEKLISDGAKRAADAVLCYLDDGFNKAMNKYN